MGRAALPLSGYIPGGAPLNGKGSIASIRVYQKGASFKWYGQRCVYLGLSKWGSCPSFLFRGAMWSTENLVPGGFLVFLVFPG